ncbi:MAG: hypothetical protein K0S12_1874, partial [Bacteroidetes bacterium]|nr:hypothetical protein [Bacteroidota bacterium]
LLVAGRIGGLRENKKGLSYKKNT